MRLHAKLLGNNPFCIFPIWLVYCTFKRTERIKYTLWTGTTSQPFWKARAMGILLLSPRLYRRSPTDCSISFLQNTHMISLVSQWSELQKPVPSCTKIPPEHGCKYTSLLYSLAGWAPWATLCKSHTMVQFYTFNAILTPNHKPRELWSMETNKTENDARISTSVYLLSYHSLKLLSNSI